MKPTNTLKTGEFGTKELKIKYLSGDENCLVVFFHGAFGRPFVKDDHYEILMKRLNQDLDVCVGIGQTSSLDPDKNDEFSKIAELYNGKTFEQELGDVRTIYQFFHDNFLKSLLGESDRKIVFCGFSLGGTLSSFLVKEYEGKGLKEILLFGSGCSTKRPDLPILNTYPKKEHVLRNLKDFKGSVTLFQGSEDEVVDKESGILLLNSAENAFSKSLVSVDGADHRFVKRNGENYDYIDFLFSQIKMAVLR